MSPAVTSMRRPVRVANCSGALTDPGTMMLDQARHGPVDVITGDYLAEVTMATDAFLPKGSVDGWVPSALDGIRLTLEIADEKRIKIIVNGGAKNPRGMAERVHQMIREKGLNLVVAYVEGDNLMPKVHELIKNSLQHLDSANRDVQISDQTRSFLASADEDKQIVTANAYLGYRAIKKGLNEGADIIVCGRVADASPVMAAAAWWHGWTESDLDELAGSLIAGHLIECSTYVTGGNFAGAHTRAPKEFVRLGAGIAEIDGRGHCVITKHDALNGFVTADTVKCQLLYELQGNIYLNSDVKADIADVRIAQVAENRVMVAGVRGHPPPPTTKLAVFYHGGWQSELLINACGYATDHKWDTQELQFRTTLEEWSALDKFDVLEFQRIGTAMENPSSQLASTTYMRIFAQSRDQAAFGKLREAWYYHFMCHFPGMHGSFDWRSFAPMPFNAYFPALISQSEIEESVTVIHKVNAAKQRRHLVGPPKRTEPLAPRLSYESPKPVSLVSFGPASARPLGDLVLGRSGDKGANVNLGLFVQNAEQWEWFRSFMTRDRLRKLMGKDWRESYHLERVELPNIFAVHFVVYGLLGRGVSSASTVDGLGKGFAEFIRAVHVPIPDKLFDD